VKELIELLPALQKIHYLNYAATGPLLTPAAAAWKELVEEAREPLQFHRDGWLSRLEKSRRAVAELIGASVEEIAFVTNTSSGLSLIANAIRWQENDQIFYPSDEFPSNRYVWDNLKQKGVFPHAVDPVPGVSFAEQLSRLDLARVRLVAVSAVSYWDGRRHDIAALSKLCREKGILLAVDAIQAAGAIPIDVRAWDCDFLSCGGQKWLFGPVGTGFVYIKKSRIEELFVPQIGWASSRTPRDFEMKTLIFADGARRFEPGLSDIPAIGALGVSIETIRELGWGKIHSRILSLVEAARRSFLELGIEPLTPPGASGILAVPMKEELNLSDKKIFATQRSGRLRISLHASVREEDLAALFEAISKRPQSISLPVFSSPGAQPSQKRALVTGASGSLGSAIAKELAKRGFSLILVGRRQEKLASLANEIATTFGTEAKACPLDLSDPEQVKNVSFEIDFLANCAADADAELFSEEDPASLRKQFETNFFSPLALAQKIAARGKGTILNIVTGGARCALPLFSSYSATKGALWAWSEALQRETAGTGVSVTTFLPPHMDSDTAMRLGRKALAYYSIGKAQAKASPAAVANAAVTAALSGAAFSAPLAVRLKLALNALFPTILSKAIQRRWKR